MEIENSKFGDQDSGKRQKPTKEDYQASLGAIASIYSDMVKHAEQVSLTRCPYKNRLSECTAKIGCRNQDRSKAGVVMCKGDDELDYRTAWETDPGSASEMHQKLKSGRSS